MYVTFACCFDYMAPVSLTPEYVQAPTRPRRMCPPQPALRANARMERKGIQRNYRNSRQSFLSEHPQVPGYQLSRSQLFVTADLNCEASCSIFTFS